jgi:hypothetical protein
MFCNTIQKTLVVESLALARKFRKNSSLGPETGLVENLRAQDPAPNFKL